MKRYFRNYLSVLSVIALPICLVLSQSSDVSAIDDYPYSGGCIDCTDPWRFYTRQCTSFVAWRLNSTNRFNFNNDFDSDGETDFGHAANWKNAALKFGFVVNNTPAPGSVAWLKNSNHVAWVESVSDTNVTIQEYNYPYNNSYNRRTVSRDAFEYIHFKDINIKHRYTPGVYNIKGTAYEFHLNNKNDSNSPSNIFTYGNNTGHHTVVVGDWNGNGTTTVGLISYSGDSLRWFLRNKHAGGDADLVFNYGKKGDIPIVGDWDGNGTVTIGVVRKNGTSWQWLLRNTNSAGSPSHKFNYGSSTSTPITGDWNGNDTWSIGVVYPRSDNRLRWLLRNSLSAGAYQIEVIYGRKSMTPITGDWDGNGTFTPGAVEKTSTNLKWHLRNSNTSGVANTSFIYGSSVHKPIVGDWDGRA